MEFYTFVLPSGKDGNEILVMTDIFVRNGITYPMFKEISSCSPLYFSESDIQNLFSEIRRTSYNLWTIDDINSLLNHD